MTSEETEVLESTFENHFTAAPMERDDSFLENWEALFDKSNSGYADKALNEGLLSSRPISFQSPQKITIEKYQSFAGPIPLITFGSSGDFENFVTNLVYKGVRPDNLSSTGASFIYGKKIRFIALSSKPYSNVPATELGLKEDEWKEKSMIIRREHECSHYYTKWHYGIAENRLHDELIADFNGLYAAFGFYKADYFLHFMGVKGKSGKRLVCYYPKMTDELFKETGKIATEAARFLEKWSQSGECKSLSVSQRIDYLTSLSVADMCKNWKA